MNVDRRYLLSMLCMTPVSAFAQQTGFAGLGGAADGFASVVPGQAISFPDDHGAHSEFRIEWWYVTANLSDADGILYGAQFTLFRQAAAPAPQREGWANQQFWLGHAAITTADKHVYAEKFGRGGIGQAGARAEPFEAWVDDWSLASTDKAFSPLRLRAGVPAFGYDLKLSTDAAMVLQGDDGYSVKSDRGQASYYVSQPFFAAEGSLRLGSREIAVSGKAWMDREWSSQPLAPDQEGWDWFSLHLDSGEKVMLFRLRHTGGAHYFAGNWISPQGTSTSLSSTDIQMQPMETASVAGRDIPVAWQLSIPSRNLEIETAPLNPQSWNSTGFPYWEGPITLKGSHEGDGYLEMTGYPEAADKPVQD